MLPQPPLDHSSSTNLKPADLLQIDFHSRSPPNREEGMRHSFEALFSRKAVLKSSSSRLLIY